MPCYAPARSLPPLGKGKKSRSSRPDTLVENRKARFEFEISDEYEAGMSLLGSEVKAIRDGKMSLAEAFCQFENGELFLVQSHIGEYVQAHGRNHPPSRKRKLLLHRRELERLQDAVKLEGVTIVPLAVYLKDRRLKLAIGVGKGKKLHDKRHSIKARDQAREMQRAKNDY